MQKMSHSWDLLLKLTDQEKIWESNFSWINYIDIPILRRICADFFRFDSVRTIYNLCLTGTLGLGPLSHDVFSDMSF